MLNRNKVLPALIKYFEEKGRVLTYQEYARETGTPVRVQDVTQIFGTWARLERLIMTKDNKPESSLNTDEVVAAFNKAQYDAELSWKAASENQDKKALKEAQAQVVAERLSANAATAAGANANKLAIGGKLPSEQQDFSAIGATVLVDPATLEQTVVDTHPELLGSTVEASGKTPAELRASVSVKAGDVPVDASTAGGSTGAATVAALGDAEKAPAKK